MEEILNENSFKSTPSEVKEWAEMVRSNVVHWRENGDTLVDSLEFDGYVTTSNNIILACMRAVINVRVALY